MVGLALFAADPVYVVMRYLSGVYLEKCSWATGRIQKWISAGNILLNLSILGVFKYFDFFTENLVNVLHLLGWDADYVTLNILAPCRDQLLYVSGFELYD